MSVSPSWQGGARQNTTVHIMASRRQRKRQERGQGWGTPKDSNHLLPPVTLYLKLLEPPKIASIRGPKPSMRENVGTAQLQVSAPTSLEGNVAAQVRIAHFSLDS